MAINSTKSVEHEKSTLTLTIDNGDLQALEDVMEQYSFVSVESLLRFALYTLRASEDNMIYIKKDGANVRVIPAKDQLKQKGN